MGANPGGELNVTRRTACKAVIDALERHDDLDFKVENLTLYESVDTEALNNLFTHKTDSNISINFDIGDETVKVWKEENEVSAQIIGE